MQLTKGVYGGEFDSLIGPFDLMCGQMRGRGMTHNSGWYNRLGEKLGFGDLSVEDFDRIAAGLEEGELFIILSESDSFWNFVTKPGHFGYQAKTQPTVEAPGVEYVAAHAMYVIGPKQFYCSGEFIDPGKEILQYRGLTFKVLQPDAVLSLIRG